VGLLLLAAAVVAASPSTVIQADERIGAFAVKRDGSLGGLVEAFGRPSSLRRTGTAGCIARWRPLRMQVRLYNLGGRDPCSREGGRFGRAFLAGRRWRTSKGLRIGDALPRLRTLYPRATRYGSWWWLVTRRTPFGLGGRYAGLAAKVSSGRVVSFRVEYPAGGD
jgi:hypothetical protein